MSGERLAADASLGYVVVTYNQASGWPGFDGEPSLYEDVDEAIEARDRARAETASTGRRDRHVVAEVIEMDEGDAGGLETRP